MKKSIFALFVLTLVSSAPSLFATPESNRMALFQLGAGFGFPSYPSEAEYMLSLLDAQPGVNRVQISFDLALGIALNHGLYLMGRIDGTGDRLYDSMNYIQVNLYLYSLGLRYYPQTTGLYLEGGVGMSAGVTQTSFAGDHSSDKGFGFGAGIGYDFTRQPTGFGLSLEAKYNLLEIQNYQYGALMLTLNLCWK